MTDTVAILITDITRLALPVAAFLASVALIYALMLWLMWRSSS
jgi:hypothetical protein